MRNRRDAYRRDDRWNVRGGGETSFCAFCHPFAVCDGVAFFRSFKRWLRFFLSFLRRSRDLDLLELSLGLLLRLRLPSPRWRLPLPLPFFLCFLRRRLLPPPWRPSLESSSSSSERDRERDRLPLESRLRAPPPRLPSSLLSSSESTTSHCRLRSITSRRFLSRSSSSRRRRRRSSSSVGARSSPMVCRCCAMVGLRLGLRLVQPGRKPFVVPSGPLASDRR